MSAPGPGSPAALVVCDVGPGIGVGHLMRCLALAEELRDRGYAPVFAAAAESVPFAAEQLASRALPHVPPPTGPRGMLRLVDETGPALVVVDSYRLPAEVYATVRATGVPLVALVDGDPEGREADVYVNQNLGGEQRPAGIAPEATWLGGVGYALMRDEILRPATAPAPRPGDRPRVLAFFGGTDPFGAAPVVAGLLVRTGLPFEAVVVAASASLADRVRAVEPGPGQDLVVVPPLSRLASAVRDADAVVSAAGTSVWELLCLGAASAVVQVADNQRAGYEAVTAGGAALGLGHLDRLSTDPAAGRTAAVLLGDPVRREQLRRRARATVDGRGRRRVVDAALAALTPDRSTSWSGN